MSRRSLAYVLFTFAVLSLLAACGSTASPPPPSPTPTEAPVDRPTPTATPSYAEGSVTFEEGFEGTLEGWERGADLPDDPDNPGQPVAWSIEISADQAVEGEAAAQFTLDGKQDDGTIWLMRPFDVGAGETLRVRLAFDLWSASESFNTLARIAAYAGGQPPAAEADFDLSRAANEAEGWKRYEYAFEVQGSAGGQIWIALGISAVWETPMTYFVDEVRVEIAPATADEGQPPGGDVAIEGVRVTAEQVAIRGASTLPEGTCVNTELWAGGAPQPWWPTDACAPVKKGAWQLTVPLEAEQALQPGVQYVVRAYQPGGPNVVSTFPFDLEGPPPPPAGDDPALILPESAVPLHTASADLNGDAKPEEIVLAGWGRGGDRLDYDFLQTFVIATDEAGEYYVAWQSEQLPTDRAEPLQVQDVNGDGLPEVVSVQAMGANGETLYLLGQQGDGYGWLSPQGGRFDGQDSFGETGARLEDRDGDGRLEVLASYGPASQQMDIYGWDGEAYVYRETLGN